MPIRKIYWPGDIGRGRDIHVLRGERTRDLTPVLRFVRQDGTNTDALDYLIHVADVTLTFMPLFRGATNGTDFVGDNNGITVDTMLGIVSVDAGVPLRRKNNFIMEVEARNDADGRTSQR